MLTLLTPSEAARLRAANGAISRPETAQSACAAARLGNSQVMRHSCGEHEPSRRQERYDLRRELRTFTALARVKNCGAAPILPTVTLRANEDGHGAGFTGLETCGSVWACPVCAAKIARHRSEEISAALAAADSEGLAVSMMTLTMRHHKGQRLADLWDGLSYAWRAMTSGKAWKEDRESIGLAGYVRAVEVTHGGAGWHVHIHWLIVSEAAPGEATVSRIFTRWQRALARRGFDSVAGSGGLDFQTARRGDAATLGRYAAKMGFSGLAAEATLGGFKRARRGNRTPFQILHDITTQGDYDDLVTWWEYEQASKGRRAITWSRGFRARFGMEEEKTDEEVAAEEKGDDALISFAAPIWRRQVEPHAAQILDACERGGLSAVVKLLHSLGVPFNLLERNSYKSIRAT